MIDTTTTPVFAPKQVIARFASKSRPGCFNEVMVGADGNVYCSCMDWKVGKKNRHLHPHLRSCKHTRAALANMVHGGRLVAAPAPAPETAPTAAPKPAKARRPSRTFWERL